MIERLRRWLGRRRRVDESSKRRPSLTPDEAAERKRVFERRYERLKRTRDQK